MAKDSTKAPRGLTEAVTILAEIVRELDPGRVNQYDRVAEFLEKTRGHIARADAFES